MAAAVDEVEDLKTCSICFYPYDEDAHKPKFLSCHHTFCLECIRTLPRAKGGVLSCPKCRKKTSCAVGQVMKLANNPYAIHMITAGTNNNPAAPQTGFRLKVNHDGFWCTNCKKEAVPSCMTDHSTLSMGSKSADFCLQLLKSKDVNEAQLSSIIQKRKEARTYLHEVSNAYKLVGEAIRRLEDENNVHFAQMNSLLENSATIIKPDETAQSLSLKLEETRDMIKEELKDVQALENSYLRHINGKTKIYFSCHREGRKVPSNMPLYDQEADVNNPDQMEQRKMLKAATHVLLSLLKIGDHQPAPPPPAAVNPPNVPAVNRHQMMPTTRLQNAIFAMTFQQSIPLTGSSTTNINSNTIVTIGNGRNSTVNINYGTVFIRASTAFYGPPSASFGLFNISTAPHLSLIGTSIGSAVAGSYINLPRILE